ncbi:hypothetical protein ACIBI9_26830 [Nonomuraea sp. NPDC050451]|uniref:hypothetical protein n=1 Tax=Nonomuraea sp. NPDC050451 TaxID=3364364 RepID=UPI0037AE62B9
MKRFVTIAVLAAATLLTLTVSPDPASADTVVSYYPTRKMCVAAAKTLTALSLGTKKYYCVSRPSPATSHKVMRVTN